MDLGLDGRTALVTGGASGIGKATAARLAAEGARVILTDLKGDALSRATEEVGRGCAALQADLRDPRQVSGLAESVRERFAMPDILVCAAGVTGAKGHPLDRTDAEWQDAWETDFLSAVRIIRAFAPEMQRRGWGRIVVTASENAAQPYPDEVVYNAAKAALLNYAKGLSAALARDGILVNAVSPAFIETPMTDGMMDRRADRQDASRDEAVKTFLREERPFLALDRRGRPEEVAAVIAFLCSDLASFVTGANYRVDGGSVGTMAL